MLKSKRLAKINHRKNVNPQLINMEEVFHDVEYPIRKKIADHIGNDFNNMSDCIQTWAFANGWLPQTLEFNTTAFISRYREVFGETIYLMWMPDGEIEVVQKSPTTLITEKGVEYFDEHPNNYPANRIAQVQFWANITTGEKYVSWRLYRTNTSLLPE